MDIDNILCSIVNDVPYIITTAGGHYNVYRLSLGASIDDISITRVVSALIPTDAHEHYSDRVMVDVQWSPQGLTTIFNLSNNHIGRIAPAAYTHISFLPTASLCQPTSPQVGDSPIIIETMLEGNIPYSCYSDPAPYVFASAQSGSYKAVINQHDPKFDESFNRSLYSLHLLQFDGDLENPGVQIRRLEVPFYIDLLKIYDIAMDERRGVIYLSHNFGHLFTIPYV